MNPGLRRAIARRLRAMWPLGKILADLVGEASPREIANAVRTFFAGGKR